MLNVKAHTDKSIAHLHCFLLFLIRSWFNSFSIASVIPMIFHLEKKGNKIGKGIVFGNIMILNSGPQDWNRKFLCKSTLDRRKKGLGNDSGGLHFAITLASRDYFLSCYIWCCRGDERQVYWEKTELAVLLSQSQVFLKSFH